MLRRSTRAVPERHLWLADLPAEQDVDAVALRGKVEQSFVEVLHLHAGVVDTADAVGDFLCLACDLLRDLTNLGGCEIAAVAGDSRHEFRLAQLRVEEHAAVLDHPLGDRPQLHERCIRLVRCEKTLQCRAMITVP